MSASNQLHDLGKLLFGFSCFWMYIWFSQYMLIWYVNIPEEVRLLHPSYAGTLVAPDVVESVLELGHPLLRPVAASGQTQLATSWSAFPW